MYSLHLSPEQIEIRDTVREFVSQEIRPAAIAPVRLEAAEPVLPLAELDKASEMGLRALGLPEDIGGAGADRLTSCLVAEELAAGDVTLAAILTETAALAQALFGGSGTTEEQRERFLSAFLDDPRYHLAYADREPHVDTELGVNYHRPAISAVPIETTATREADGSWVLSGTKERVGNAAVAKLFVVKAKADPRAAGGSGVALFLVERDTPGLTIRESQDGTLRQHGAPGEVAMRSCRVPAANLLPGDAAAALDTALADMPQRGAVNLGVGRAAFEAALDYAQLRVQGGRRLIEHQAIGTRLADVAIRLEAVRATLWQAAWAADHPEAVADRSLAEMPLQTMARAFTAETVYGAVKDAAECFGAMGVMRDMPLQKYIGDALVFLHAGNGTTDAKLRIAEALAGYERPFGGSAAPVAAE